MTWQTEIDVGYVSKDSAGHPTSYVATVFLTSQYGNGTKVLKGATKPTSAEAMLDGQAVAAAYIATYPDTAPVIPVNPDDPWGPGPNPDDPWATGGALTPVSWAFAEPWSASEDTSWVTTGWEVSDASWSVTMDSGGFDAGSGFNADGGELHW